MNPQQLAFVSVIDEPRISEPLHEEANARSRRSHHFCEGRMTDMRNRSLGRSVTIKMGQQQESTRQSFLAQIAAQVH